MAATHAKPELYKPGEKVPYSAEYAVTDAHGKKQDLDVVTLDRTETFPHLANDHLRYMLIPPKAQEASKKESINLRKKIEDASEFSDDLI